MPASRNASTNRQVSSGRKQGGRSNRAKSGGRGNSNNAQVDQMFEALGVSGSAAGAGEGGVDMDELLQRARTYVNDQLEKARSYADEHPRVVLGSLAGLVVGAGLLTAAALRDDDKGRGSRSRSGRSSSRSSSKKSSSSKSSKSGSSKSGSSKGGSKKGSSSKSSGSRSSSSRGSSSKSSGSKSGGSKSRR